MWLSNAIGLRYPTSEYRLETSTISPGSQDSEESELSSESCEPDRHDFPFEKIGSKLDMFHEQLPLPVPCYDLVLVTEFTVVLRKADLRVPPAPLT